MINIKTLKFLQEINDSNYLELKSNLLFHSNKIKGFQKDMKELKCYQTIDQFDYSIAYNKMYNSELEL